MSQMPPQLDDVEYLRQKYTVERLSSYQIGDVLKCSSSSVLRALCRGNIHVRTRLESQSGANERNRKSHMGKRHSKETIDKMRKAAMGSNNPMLGKSHSEEVRKRIAASKMGSKNPNFGKTPSDATIEKLRIARRSCKFPKHHTQPELQFEAICRNNQLPFEFTGNGKVWIGKRGKQSINPDFTGKSNGKRFAVFVNGDYWHSQLLRPQLTVTQRPEYQISHSKKHRWVPIILWETDLKREDAEAFVLATLAKAGFSM